MHTINIQRYKVILWLRWGLRCKVPIFQVCVRMAVVVSSRDKSFHWTCSSLHICFLMLDPRYSLLASRNSNISTFETCELRIQRYLMLVFTFYVLAIVQLQWRIIYLKKVTKKIKKWKLLEFELWEKWLWNDLNVMQYYMTCTSPERCLFLTLLFIVP